VIKSTKTIFPKKENCLLLSFSIQKVIRDCIVKKRRDKYNTRGMNPMNG